MFLFVPAISPQHGQRHRTPATTPTNVPVHRCAPELSRPIADISRPVCSTLKEDGVEPAVVAHDGRLVFNLDCRSDGSCPYLIRLRANP